MIREQVSSSMIQEIGFDKEKEILEVEFNTGNIFQYEDVPEEIYDDLMEGVSIGKTFNELIRNKFKFERVD